jgi:hypothetical protein
VSFEKMYAVAGILSSLCGVRSLYEIYAKLIDETICLRTGSLLPINLSLYLAGAAGFLSGLSKMELFHTAAEVVV